MGTYITRADVETRFGARNVALWADVDDDDAVAMEAKVDAAIAWAEGQINNRFRQSRYLIPFVATSGALPVVANWATVLAGWWLYTIRGLREDDATAEALAPLKEAAEEEMAIYLANARQLPAASRSSQPSGPEIV